MKDVCWDSQEGMLPKPPFAVKKTQEGYLEFGQHGVKISVKLPKVPQKDILIPYDEIYAASYVPATKWLKGFLCVREWKERHRPLPRTFWEKSLRDSLIWFSQKDNDEFCRAYEFLKQCAEINANRK